jgi:hypothetical protein
MKIQTEVEAAIKSLIAKSIATETKAHEALQLTQSALNLAHTAQVVYAQPIKVGETQ